MQGPQGSAGLPFDTPHFGIPIGPVGILLSGAAHLVTGMAHHHHRVHHAKTPRVHRQRHKHGKLTPAPGSFGSAIQAAAAPPVAPAVSPSLSSHGVKNWGNQGPPLPNGRTSGPLSQTTAGETASAGPIQPTSPVAALPAENDSHADGSIPAGAETVSELPGVVALAGTIASGAASTETPVAAGAPGRPAPNMSTPDGLWALPVLDPIALRYQPTALPQVASVTSASVSGPAGATPHPPTARPAPSLEPGPTAASASPPAVAGVRSATVLGSSSTPDVSPDGSSPSPAQPTPVATVPDPTLPSSNTDAAVRSEPALPAAQNLSSPDGLAALPMLDPVALRHLPTGTVAPLQAGAVKATAAVTASTALTDETPAQQVSPLATASAPPAAASPLANQHLEQIAEMVHQAATLAHQGSNRPVSMSLRLDPPSLGSITVHMTHTPHGIEGTVTTSSAQVTKQLSSALGDLTTRLAQQGITLGSLNVSTGERRATPVEVDTIPQPRRPPPSPTALPTPRSGWMA